MPEILSSRTVYEGRVFDIRRDQVREGDAEYMREVIVHSGSSVILPVFADGTLALVRQYRHAVGKYLLEAPAGTLDDDESPELGAIRELEEEVGVIAENIEKIAEFYVSPGFLTEKMFVYLATGLTETSQKLDDDEFVEIERLTFPQAFEMIRNGQIEDAKTIVGVTLAATKLGLSL